MFKSYLGDAVYVEYDGYNIVLTTSNGIEDTNRILLEPVVREAFKNWLFHLYDRLEQMRAGHITNPTSDGKDI